MRSGDGMFIIDMQHFFNFLHLHTYLCSSLFIYPPSLPPSLPSLRPTSERVV